MDLKTNYIVKKTQFSDALTSLFEALQHDTDDDMVRDACIQRFKYTAELFWKMLKEYLFEELGVEVSSPKKVIRESFSQNLFSEQDAENFLEMLNDRNRTSHAYEEGMAIEIMNKIEEYADRMSDVEKSFNK